MTKFLVVILFLKNAKEEIINNHSSYVIFIRSKKNSFSYELQAKIKMERRIMKIVKINGRSKRVLIKIMKKMRRLN